MIVWSASHGWSGADNRPVSSRAPEPAGELRAPSSRLDTDAGPAATTSVPTSAVTVAGAGAGASQKRSRWKAYVGRSTRRAPAPAKIPRQSSCTPAVNSVASAPVTAWSSGLSRRSSGIRAAVAAAAPVRQSCAIAVSTPSGPSSQNLVTPAACNQRTLSWKRTVSRACRTQ